MRRERERGREMWSLGIGGKSDGSSFDNMDTRLAITWMCRIQMIENDM